MEPPRPPHGHDRDYPRTWFLLDLVDDHPRLLGREVVDLSPAAIELRRAARELRDYADERGQWLPMGEEGGWERLDQKHRRPLSFGPEVAYCVEHDGTRTVHDGEPVRHLALRSRRGSLTPATSAEVAFYFYGRRPAAMGFVGEGRAHGFIGFDWEPLSAEDVRWLLRREMRTG